MKIITLATIKGGVGKTTLTLNLGAYLASKGSKVLLIDLDSQCNLTTALQVKPNLNSVLNIFEPNTTNQTMIQHVYPNLDLIAGDLQLSTDLDERLEKHQNCHWHLNDWLQEYFESHDEYDYILIDTHNSHPFFDVFLGNALCISDYVLIPISPDDLGFKSKTLFVKSLQQFANEEANPHTKESYVNVKVKYIGNQFYHSNTANLLAQRLKTDNDTVAIVPRKEALHKTTNLHQPLVNLLKDSKFRHNYGKSAKEIFNQFDEVIAKLN